MNPVIRRAEFEDIGQIMVLYQDHLHPSNRDTRLDSRLLNHWQKILDNPWLNYFVAEVDGDVVATCNLTVVPNVTHDLQPFGVIENVVTHTEYRRKGFGRAVLEMALEAAWQDDCYKVMLLSGSTRVESHRFYESVGFSGDAKKGFVAYRSS